MDIIDERRVYIQSLDTATFNDAIAALDVLRLDTIHPEISGNKWYKLKGNVVAAISKGANTLLTFGGAYSNHLHATAAAASLHGLKSIGVVRGLHAAENLTPTLQQCTELGMKLKFVSKEEYALKEDAAYLNSLRTKYAQAYIIPEGGANEEGRAGAASIASLIPESYSHICLSVGTGTTLSGIRNALPADIQVMGFAPMKGGKYLEETVRPHLSEGRPFKIFDDWHFGGFGKWNADLIAFMNSYYTQYALPLDVVYTSKMMFGIETLIAQGYFPTNAHILCIHTGGLQGNTSVQHLLSF